MDKILFENVLKLSDLHPAMQRRLTDRRQRRKATSNKQPQRSLEQRLWGERVAEIGFEVGLVRVVLP